MAESLTLAGVVETLVDLDLVDLFADGPWPPEPDAVDVYEVDWTQVHPTQPDDQATVATGMPIDSEESPWSVFDEVNQRAGEGFMGPYLPDVPPFFWVSGENRSVRAGQGWFSCWLHSMAKEARPPAPLLLLDR